MTSFSRTAGVIALMAVVSGVAASAQGGYPPAMPPMVGDQQVPQGPQGPPNGPARPGGQGPQNGQPQGPNGRGNMPGDQLSPGDVQAMLEAMTLFEAERFVMLTPEQYPNFVVRLKKLQEARGMLVRRHNRAFNELRGMANPQNGKADEATIDAKLKELDQIEVECRAAIAKALEMLDQILTPKQRARFRMLEDNMEKKKLDLLMKVRQPGGRGGV